MFGLKVAYFYLIAIQITLIKFLKKIYFSTNYYNKSLISKIPKQVYYNPNPFILSIISPYTKTSFKVNAISPNDFWIESKDKNLKEYHNFLWLSLIDRKIDVKNIDYDELCKINKEKQKLLGTFTFMGGLYIFR